MRDILGRQIETTPLSSSEVLHFQQAIEHTTTQVKGRADILDSASNNQQSTYGVPSGLNNEGEMRLQSIHAWGTELTAQSSVFAAWSRKLLHLMIEKAHCTLYHPLQKGTSSELWHQFRET